MYFASIQPQVVECPGQPQAEEKLKDTAMETAALPVQPSSFGVDSLFLLLYHRAFFSAYRK